MECCHYVHSAGHPEHGRQRMDRYSLRMTSEVLEIRRGRREEKAEDRYLHGATDTEHSSPVAAPIHAP
jgi:hypothetical protein